MRLHDEQRGSQAPHTVHLPPCKLTWPTRDRVASGGHHSWCISTRYMIHPFCVPPAGTKFAPAHLSLGTARSPHPQACLKGHWVCMPPSQERPSRHDTATKLHNSTTPVHVVAVSCIFRRELSGLIMTPGGPQARTRRIHIFRKMVFHAKTKASTSTQLHSYKATQI